MSLRTSGMSVLMHNIRLANVTRQRKRPLEHQSNRLGRGGWMQLKECIMRKPNWQVVQALLLIQAHTQTSTRQAEAAKAYGHRSYQSDMPNPMVIRGVGDGTQGCTKSTNVPVAVPRVIRPQDGSDRPLAPGAGEAVVSPSKHQLLMVLAKIFLRCLA